MTATMKHEQTYKGAMGDGMPSILMRAPELTTKGLLKDDFDGLCYPMVSHGIPIEPPWGTAAPPLEV
jgi:hypothetical protein